MNQAINLIIYRQASFFNSRSQDELWKSVTTVSNAGRMRGRAKGLMRIKDLNRGQKLGMGKNRVSFPGLTDNIKRDKDGNTNMKIEEISKEKYAEYLDDYSTQQMSLLKARGRKKYTPLQRGWTSATPMGQKFGPPESTNPDADFDEFESILIESRVLTAMTGQLGRTQKSRKTIVTGNGNGLLGMATIQSAFGGAQNASYRRCVNRAGKRVVFIDRYEDRTVFHDFFSQFGSSRVFVQQKPYGYGISAHRVIAAACELVGLKDIRVIIEGRTHNSLNILKAFILGLLRQRTHQQLANEKGLHLVEFREEMGNYPLVVASPEDGVVRTEEEIGKNEILDFEAVGFDGNYANIRPVWPGFPTKSNIQIRKKAPFRQTNQDRRRLLMEEGEVKSFLTDIFPECKPYEWKRKSKESE